MKKLIPILFVIFNLTLIFNTEAGLPINYKVPPGIKTKASPRAACLASTSAIDQSINNVRARLLAGGDVWWDGKNIPKYIVPKVPIGQPEVSSIFAGAVWIGGKDEADNIKLAAMTYRTNGFDFWPGPLDKDEGTTSDSVCANWDRHWKVLGKNIELHINAYKKAVNSGQSYNCDQIPEDIKGWPARGNQYFFEINKFNLPTATQGLAAFFDRNGDDNYDPCDGDYPIIEIRGCDAPVYPDEMIFWIYNDNGNVHTQSKGSEAIQMEVQVQAFAYATNNELNNMTFQRYKLINRATTLIKECYFAMWLDPDLGCATDDYVGCDTTRSLMYIYNQDAQDGTASCNCGTTNTYCNEIPMLGCDYFRGPLIINIDTITGKADTTNGRMTSFTIYVNGGGIYGPPGSDPSTSQEYYNYITGRWKDGRPLTYGGNGYDVNSTKFVNYAFIDEPCKPNGWSMASSGFPGQDFRTLQATGPINLLPGQVNELIIGLPWVPDIQHPKPCIEQIQQADDIAQSLFDNCFKITDGPDAPDLDFIELNNELVMVMTNDTLTSNNAFEKYVGNVLGAPNTTTDTLYRFEGYRVYQLANGSIGYSTSELTDVNKARVVVQVDVKNGVKEIYNWSASKNPITNELYWTPESKTGGLSKDEGTRHVFHFTEDQFASNDKRLINHKKYYYVAIAYAYNNYEQFDSKTAVGQRAPYLAGRRNVKTYAPVPRPIVDRTLNATYNEGVEITRLDGTGTSSNFLNISNEMREKILNGTNDEKITYIPGNGPFELKVFNPLDVKDGEYQLVIKDNNNSDTILDSKSAYWYLTRLNTNEEIKSEGTIEKFNEQVVAKYGFSIALGQVEEPGTNVFKDVKNGAIGGTTEYLDPTKTQWLSSLVDGAINDGVNSFSGLQFKAISNQEQATDPDFNLDPYRGLSKLGPFQPYGLCDYRPRVLGGANIPYITAGWMLESTFGPVSRGNMSNLNNVDIVFTSDKSKWSRCVVVESANAYYTNKKNASNPLTNFYLGLETEKNPDGKVPLQFDLRGKYSVGKNDSNNDGLPDEDNLTDPVTGKRLYGMGWFPGYAIDVESGQRLNIFFGENSCYRPEIPVGDTSLKNGADMLWNPKSNVFDISAGNNAYGQYFGGQHYIYVSRTKYDECDNIRKVLSGTNKSLKAVQLKNITWTCMPILKQGSSWLPLGNSNSGLIPNDAVVKMRVANSFLVEKGTGANNGYPTYQFSIKNKEAKPLVDATINSSLDMINVVPNPYYGFSNYEISETSYSVKITNLPAKCNVTIYSLDGQFVRQYKRNELAFSNSGRSNPPISVQQITPALEWDLKNSKGIPISSGVYLIHVNAEGMGERVIKWFGVARQYDPSKL